jgi:hypothetical protein
LNSFVNFFPEHSNLSRSRNAEPDLIAIYADHGDRNLVTNRETFAGAAA